MALATKMSVTPLILVQMEGAAPEFESPVTLHICIILILSLPRKQTNGDSISKEDARLNVGFVISYINLDVVVNIFFYKFVYFKCDITFQTT